jgi:Haem-NO-binding
VHGLIFAGLRAYMDEVAGPDRAWEALGKRMYVIHESHPDGLFLDAVERGSRLTGMEPDDFLRQFGVFTGEAFFPRLFPMIYEPHVSARSFLPVVDAQIHGIVREAVPDSLPPGLAVHSDGDALILAYSSERGLCVYLAGLIEGTARHYGEEARLDEQTCMRQGDPACVFRVELESA